jgi:uncharacterized protein
MENLQIKKSKISGRGVFATNGFIGNEIIESCELIKIPHKEIEYLNKTNLYNYYFLWKKEAAIVLGFGSLYNHSYKPNAKYVKNYKNSKIIFIALKIIKKGEEILINYNGNPKSKTKVWFENKGLK